MIVNLVGAPATGKSTFAARFVAENPSFMFCPIDAYRVEYIKEEEAWNRMAEDACTSKHVILESCGLNRKMAELLNTPKLRSRPLITIGLTGRINPLLERLEDRQNKRPLPERFSAEDERMAVKYVSQHIYTESVTQLDYLCDTTDRVPQDIYQELSCLVKKFILSNKDRIPTRPMYEQHGQVKMRALEL